MERDPAACETSIAKATAQFKMRRLFILPLESARTDGKLGGKLEKLRTGDSKPDLISDCVAARWRLC